MTEAQVLLLPPSYLMLLLQEVVTVNDNFTKLVEIHEAQNVEMKTVRKQCDSMRSILMHKDEEIMKLKNDLPLRKNNDNADRFENMFKTSLEVEAENKGLKGLELQLKTDEIERLRGEHEKDVTGLEVQKNILYNVQCTLLRHISSNDDVVILTPPPWT